MVPPGVLTSADRWWAERAARLMAKSRYGTLKASEETQLANYLSRMACNPADRSKVNVVPTGAAAKPHDETRNRFKGLAAEVHAARPN
jgi:hypothetical protein